MGQGPEIGFGMILNVRRTVKALASRRAFREWRYGVLGFVLVILAACGSSNVGGLFKDSEPGAPTSAPNIVGSGTKVALLLPLSMGGDMQATAAALKQSAEMALLDAGNAGIVLITKDTGGTEEGARAAAQGAVADGAKLIIGPLLAAEVSAVSPVARAAGVNVIAFSSASNVAGNGVFLMSFPPEGQVARVVSYSARNNYKNFAGIFPQGRFGETTEQAFRAAVASAGGQLGPTERYAEDRSAATQAAGRIAPQLAAAPPPGFALMLPQGGTLLDALGHTLAGASIAAPHIKVLGTGQWDDRGTWSISIAQGGWYAGVPPDLIARYDTKYRTAYRTTPPRIASLAYDAVTLAIQLNRKGGISAANIAGSDGFQGQNGPYRFNANGTISRALAVLEMSASGPRVIDSAPGSF